MNETTFTQAEVDAIIQKRLDRERKRQPDEEELAAFHAWKDVQSRHQEQVEAITAERDSIKAQVAQAQAEIEQIRRENYVATKGLSGELAEFVVHKAVSMVTDGMTFEAAVDSLVADRSKKFDWTAPLGSGGTYRHETTNDRINRMIRDAGRR